MTVPEPLGALITHRRRQLGQSQERLAEQLCALSGRVTITKNEVSRYERGRRVPNARSLKLLAAALGLPLVDLERAAAGARSRAVTPAEPVAAAVADAAEREEGAVDRREMLRQLAAASLVVAGWPVGTAHGVDLPARVTAEHVAELREATGLYRTWVRRHGGGGLGRHVAALLERASMMHSAARDGATRTLLLECIADLAGLGAYVARDVELHDYAGRMYQLGLQAANASGDRHLGGHLIVRMAGHNIELRRPEETLGLLSAARQAAAAVLTPGERANQHCIEAWANAQRGDAAAVRRAVGQAEDEFARSDGTAAPEWGGQHVTEAELYSLTGAGYVDLARTDARHCAHAVERLERAIALRGDAHARNRTLDLLSLAEALAIAGEPVEASRTADQALGLFGGITSGRLRRRFAETAATFGAHGGRAAEAETARLRLLSASAAGSA
ncbi:helix-turn-helix transcriptional regulator [Catellatospora sp. NPDC049133]|uniref:helix-turn-helix transcriptional regulator n=1 Tax=Catellatospora sp. NPDC049133 TaxID=3155499 RepID=UPI0033D18C81